MYSSSFLRLASISSATLVSGIASFASCSLSGCLFSVSVSFTSDSVSDSSRFSLSFATIASFSESSSLTSASAASVSMLSTVSASLSSAEF